MAQKLSDKKLAVLGTGKLGGILLRAYLKQELFSPKREVIIMRQPSAGLLPERYIPDTTRARNELGLTQKVTLEQAIQATLQWYSHFKMHL